MGTGAVGRMDSRSAVLNKLKWRYAAKAYDKTKKVSAEDLETLAVRLVATIEQQQ